MPQGGSLAVPTSAQNGRLVELAKTVRDLEEMCSRFTKELEDSREVINTIATQDVSNIPVLPSHTTMPTLR